MPLDLITLAINWAGSTVVNGLLAAYRHAFVLAAAILAFSAVGTGMIIGSRSVTGWWQLALLGFGSSLLIIGTINLGILGVVKGLLDPEDAKLAAHPNVASSPTEIAAALRELADRLDPGTATDSSAIKAVLDDI
jgi:hypothetical protein